MNFSVVIPTYNRQATLRRCLTALLAQTYPAHEIIVVDDGSTDGTAEMMTRDFPIVRFFRQKNAGPASARNRGIREASGDVIAFTDDDCLPPADWLERLADGYRRHPDVAGVGGYLDAPDEVLADNALAQYDYFVSH
ncbi:MAG: glycosyltransferase family 2 protein, partial [Anaerolineales bacterium]|nr:glycosyltransferase family 2 protein [Anaerolineales bacterium]